MIDILVVTLSLSVILYILRFRAQTPYPPGPSPLPLIGNLLQVPRIEYHKTYARWKDLYGDVVYMKIFGRQFVILNSAKATIDLFEKRSAIYSSRPRLVMAGELVGRNKSALFLPYGERFRATRKLLHSFLHPGVAKQHWPIQTSETHKFLGRLLRSPENFQAHIKSTAGAIILKLVYGYQIQYDDDPYVKLADALSRITTEASQPGYWLVDSFPILRYLPSWLPGAHFKRWAAERRRDSEILTKAPHDLAKTNIEQSTALPSFTANNLLQLHAGDRVSEELIMYAAASLSNGGTDTVASVIHAFFLMMTAHPTIQKKAQKEIDDLIGDERLPTMRDIAVLPYVGCIIKELHRSNPIIPLVPHSPVQDDVYEGMLIPEGAWVMSNIWAITHDPTTYPDPNRFCPERFETSPTRPPQPDPTLFTFGNGRRACPGSHFATASVFLSVAQVLWGFDISPICDEAGNEVVPPLEFTSGHSVHPKSFICTITPRSAERAELIDHVLALGHE